MDKLWRVQGPMRSLGRDGIWSRFEQMGLAEPVPGMKNATQYTDLRKACRVDLFVAFMGAIETWDIPHTLLENGLIDDVERLRKLERTVSADSSLVPASSEHLGRRA